MVGIQNYDAFVEIQKDKEKNEKTSSYVKVYHNIELKLQPFGGFLSSVLEGKEKEKSLTKFLNCENTYTAFVEFIENDVKSILLIKQDLYTKFYIQVVGGVFDKPQRDKVDYFSNTFYKYIREHEKIHLETFLEERVKTKDTFLIGELFNFKVYFCNKNGEFEENDFKEFENILCENRYVDFHTNENEREKTTKRINFFNKTDNLPFFVKCNKVRISYNTKDKRKSIALFEFDD